MTLGEIIDILHANCNSLHVSQLLGKNYYYVSKRVAAGGLDLYEERLREIGEAYEEHGPKVFQCKYRPRGVNCDRLWKCEGCGWEPDEEARRMYERASLQITEEAMEKLKEKYREWNT